MTAEHLRGELARIGDDAPVADVPVDTWARARTARRRERGLGVLAAAAVLLVVAGLAAWLPTRDEPPVADTDSAGVPTEILGPSQFGDPLRTQTDLAVGRTAVALSAPDGPQVYVVSAGTGRYRALRLPGHEGGAAAASVPQPIALSPDGARLAYVRSGPDPADSGVGVVDLGTGAVRTIPVTGGAGVLVRTLAWSPDSRWLVWSGQVATSWSATSRRFGDDEAAGLIAPDATTSTDLPANPDSEGIAQYAVSDEGAVAISTTSELIRWDGTIRSRETLEDDGRFSYAARYQDGTLVELRQSASPGSGADVLVRHPDRSGAGGTPGAATSTELPAALGDREVSVVGWLDAQRVAVRSEAPTSDSDSAELGLLTVRGQGPADYRLLGTVPAGFLGTLSLASDLMSPEHPTVERPTPTWARSGHGALFWAAGIGGGMLVLTAAAWVFSRRRWARW